MMEGYGIRRIRGNKIGEQRRRPKGDRNLYYCEEALMRPLFMMSCAALFVSFILSPIAPAGAGPNEGCVLAVHTDPDVVDTVNEVVRQTDHVYADGTK